MTSRLQPCVRCVRWIAHDIKERIWASSPRTFAGSSVANSDPTVYEKDTGPNKQDDQQEDQSERDVYPEQTIPEQPKDDFKLTLSLMVCLSVMCLASFMSAMDYTSIGTVVSTIAADLGGSTSQSEWVGNGYSLSSCVAQLPISALSDIFGRRALLIFTIAMFLIGSVICGTAHNMEAMIAGRVIQGIGSAGNLVLPEVVLAETIPLKLRGVYYSLFMFVWSTGASVGPVIAGAFTQYVTWRWMFYLNLPVCGLALVATPLLKLKHHSAHWKEQLASVDYIGALLVTTSSTSLVLGLGRGGSSASLPWSKWSVILPIVLGCVGLIVTGFYEFYSGIRYPMFNVRVFGNLTAAMCYIQNILQGIIYMAAVFYLPTFFQGAKGLGQMLSGVAIMPLSLLGPPISVVVGWLITHTGHYNFMNYVLWALSLAGVALFTLISENRSIAMLICIQIPASIGLMCLYATLSITVNACNPPELWVDSTAMMSFCRAIGDALGTAVGGAVFASEMRRRLADLATQGVKVPESASALSISEYIKHIAPGPLRDTLVNAIARSMRTTYVVLTIFTAVGLATCFFQREYSLEATYEPRQGIDDGSNNNDSAASRSPASPSETSSPHQIRVNTNTNQRHDPEER